MSEITGITDAALAELKALHAGLHCSFGGIGGKIVDSFPSLLARLEASEREREELRADADRYRYIRREAMIVQCTGKKSHNQISWPTIRAADPIEGGNYWSRFDTAVDAQLRREGE